MLGAFSTTGATSRVRKVLGSVRVENACASSHEDRVNILKVFAPNVVLQRPDDMNYGPDIEALAGACLATNQAVASKLKHCFLDTFMERLLKQDQEHSVSILRLCGSVMFFLSQEDRPDDWQTLFDLWYPVARDEFPSELAHSHLLVNYGNCVRTRKKMDEALAAHIKAKALCEEHGNTETREYIAACSTLGITHGIRGELEESNAAMMIAKAKTEESGDTNTPVYANLTKNCGINELKLERFDRAMVLFLQAKQRFETCERTATHWYCETLDKIGEVFWEQGRKDEAKKWCQQSKKLYEKIDMTKCVGYNDMINRLKKWGMQLE